MKKLFVVLVVLAITAMGSMAFAADVTLSGSIDFRQRAFDNLDNNADVADYNRDTQTRVRVGVDAKAGDATAKIEMQRDWQTWGGVEEFDGGGATTVTVTPSTVMCVPAGGGNIYSGPCVAGDTPISIAATGSSASQILFRQAWIDVPMVGGVRLKGGHLLAQLGNGWFLRSMRNGSDAWIAYTDIDNLHLGLVDVKINDGARDNDADLYAAVAVMKLGDMKFGVDLSRVVWSKPSALAGSDVTNNIGVNASAKVGPVDLKAELDWQMGTDKTSCFLGVCSDYKGNQLVLEGKMALDPVTLSFVAARGSGNDPMSTSIDNKQIVVIQDIDPHYTFLYEYKMDTAVGAGQQHTGFANTTALSVGADMKVGAFTVGASAWLLTATEKTNIRGALDMFGLPLLSDELGMEVDAKVNWKISDNVYWNVTMGYFMPGDAYQRDNPLIAAPGSNLDADETTGIQGVLGMKF